MTAPTLPLNDGTSIPQIGLGITLDPDALAMYTRGERWLED